MIPRHRPPFNSGRIILSLFQCKKTIGIERLEEIYAEECGMPYAVLLPSARSGIYWASKASISHGEKVICPAYTCWVVHEAIIRSGGQLYLIDTEKNCYLMDEKKMNAAQIGKYSIILCETYGHTYDLQNKNKSIPSLRIVDMAMTVPNREIFRRLHHSDFALISFGIGKCIYAGWGGMGFTHDEALAKEVRKMRNSYLSNSNISLLIKRYLYIFFRTLMHEQCIYRYSRGINALIMNEEYLNKFYQQHNPNHWSNEQNLSQEWYLPSTYIDRYLLLYNLKQMDQFFVNRINLAKRYHNNFEFAKGIRRPETSQFALSHYTIRVPSEIRDSLRQWLWRAGIDVGTLYNFHPYLSEEKFPNAKKLSSEVLNLPLNTNLTMDEIDWISECVIQGVKKFEIKANSQNN